MREIKFRAWDKKAKSFVYATLTNAQCGTTFEGDYHGTLEPWQQLTGIKDSKGVEIYEGDAVILSHVQSKRKGIVTWFKESASFVVTGNPKDLAGYSLFDNTDEVIGNVWENPDLLK